MTLDRIARPKKINIAEQNYLIKDSQRQSQLVGFNA
jgi:hypothetical protein